MNALGDNDFRMVQPWQPVARINPAAINNYGAILAGAGTALATAYDRYLSPHGLWRQLSPVANMATAVLEGNAVAAAQNAPTPDLARAAAELAGFLNRNRFLRAILNAYMADAISTGLLTYAGNQTIFYAAGKAKDVVVKAYNTGSRFVKFALRKKKSGQPSKPATNSSKPPLSKKAQLSIQMYLKALIMYLTHKRKYKYTT